MDMSAIGAEQKPQHVIMWCQWLAAAPMSRIISSLPVSDATSAAKIKCRTNLF
jgi:hypothetical protein